MDTPNSTESSGSAGNRRPMSARDWSLTQSVANWLIRRRVNANVISVLGAVSSIAGGFCFAATRLESSPVAWLWLAGAVLILVRGMANIFDGMVAIGSGTASRVGELYNDVPDRISDTAFFVGAGYAAGSVPWLGWAAALASMMTAYVRALGRGFTGTQDFSGPMAKQHRMYLLCFAAAFSAGCHWLSFPGMAFVAVQAALWIIFLGSVLTTIRRLGRIARRLRGMPG